VIQIYRETRSGGRGEVGIAIYDLTIGNGLTMCQAAVSAEADTRASFLAFIFSFSGLSG